jgi:antitoxin YefM
LNLAIALICVLNHSFCYDKNVRNFVQKYFMTKVLSVTEFRNNLASELEHVCKNSRNQIIVKRPKGKGNIVILSQEAFNAIEETMYLLSTPNNKKHLLESIQELNDGKGIKFKQEDIWK